MIVRKLEVPGFSLWSGIKMALHLLINFWTFSRRRSWSRSVSYVHIRDHGVNLFKGSGEGRGQIVSIGRSGDRLPIQIFFSKLVLDGRKIIGM